MSRRKSSAATAERTVARRFDGSAGFTLLEAIVALMIVAVVLGAIGATVGATMRGARSAERRLELTAMARLLLASLPSREALRPGRQAGETNGTRWQIDVSALPTGATAPTGASWTPLVVRIKLRAREGSYLQLDTVRLARRGGE